MRAAEDRRRRRDQNTRLSLPPAEWDRLLREKAYPRPLPPVPPLHRMARTRLDLTDADHQDDGRPEKAR